MPFPGKIPAGANMLKCKCYIKLHLNAYSCIIIPFTLIVRLLLRTDCLFFQQKILYTISQGHIQIIVIKSLTVLNTWFALFPKFGPDMMIRLVGHVLVLIMFS